MGLAAIGGLAIGLVAPTLAPAVAPSHEEVDADQAHDAALEWAERLQRGQLDDLIANRQPFLIVFAQRRDSRLVPGLERLVRAVLDDDSLIAGERCRVARVLADEIAANSILLHLQRFVPVLRGLQ